MPIDPVKIPQNVYIEDRIVGPLTLRQTLIIAGGGGFSYALYATLSKAAGNLNILTTIIVWIPAAICVIFALVKINDLSLMRICFLMLERIHKPTVRTFAPRRGISVNIRTQPSKVDQRTEEMKRASEEDAKAQSKIHELSTVVDKGLVRETAPWEEEVPEEITAVPASTMQSDTDQDVEDEATREDTLPRLPVDPNRIQIDKKSEDGPELSDLSVFRDIFPSH